MPDSTNPSPTQKLLMQCPGCWSVSENEVAPDETWECECGEKLTVIDLRDGPDRALTIDRGGLTFAVKQIRLDSELQKLNAHGEIWVTFEDHQHLLLAEEQKRGEVEREFDEFEDRFESCDNCDRLTLKDDLKVIWCREAESGEVVDARICPVCRLKAAESRLSSAEAELNKQLELSDMWLGSESVSSRIYRSALQLLRDKTCSECGHTNGHRCDCSVYLAEVRPDLLAGQSRDKGTEQGESR